MIEKILPPGVAVAEAFCDPPEAWLMSAEEEVISRAVSKRRQEFTTVRWCASQALAELGVARSPILPGYRGAPQWPPGIVGSMTHCDGYRAAAVARFTDTCGLGIDAEPHEPLPGGILDAIAQPPELRYLRELCRTVPDIHADRLLFSAKESVYKVWFPLTSRRLGFEDAVITLRADGTFIAQILVAMPPAEGIPSDGFAGRWLVEDDLITTTIAAPQPPGMAAR